MWYPAHAEKLNNGVGVMTQEEPQGKATQLSIIPRLLPYFSRHAGGMVLASLTILAVTAVRLAQPMVLRYIIDTAVPAGDSEAAIKAALLFVALLMIGATVSYARVLLLARIGMRIIAGIKEEVFRHVLGQGMRFFDRTRTGTLITRTESDVDQLKPLFSQSFAHILSSVVMMAGIMGLIFWEQPRFGFLLCLVVPPGMAFMIFYVRYIRGMYRKVREKNSEMTGYVAEYIQGVPLIQLYQRETQARNRLAELNHDKYILERNLMFVDYSLCWPTFNLFFETLLLIAVFYYGSNRIYQGTMTPGTLVMFVELIRQFYQPLRELGQVISQIQSGLGAAVRVFEILDTPTDVHDHGTYPEPCHLRERLEFRQIGFSYGKDRVLHDVSFSIKHREHVAIVGASGSGKTTCVNLLLRFYDPEAGEILADGRNIRDYPLNAWRGILSLVLQEVYLFPGTIMENLKAFNPEVPDDKVKEAARLVGAHDFIMSRPEGYQTVLAERGANLSQGERQLLSYARALVRDPEILILDEATASVDVITERKLQASMESLMRGRTAVIIAHRLSTIRRADTILVFDGGRIVEAGTNDELMAKQGVYWKLVMLQAVEETAK